MPQPKNAASAPADQKPAEPSVPKRAPLFVRSYAELDMLALAERVHTSETVPTKGWQWLKLRQRPVRFLAIVMLAGSLLACHAAFAGPAMRALTIH